MLLSLLYSLILLAEVTFVLFGGSGGSVRWLIVGIAGWCVVWWSDGLW